MTKTLIGIATFGGVGFTRLAIQSIINTVGNNYNIYLVVGKPGDYDTINLANEFKIEYTAHEINWGFPKSVNDIYDFAWKTNNYDNVIIMGNDVIAYPYAIDSLIDIAKEGQYDWVSSTQLDVKTLVSQFPYTQKFFKSSTYNFTDFGSTPWEAFTGYSKERLIGEVGLSDVQNLCLYTKNAFEILGYTDVNFYPAYYVDNDYARRGVNLNIKACTAFNSVYFHFWSRTIHQGQGGSTNTFFERNREFYKQKWGGDFGKERWKIPFNGVPNTLTPSITLKPFLKIPDRALEKDIITYWMNK